MYERVSLSFEQHLRRTAHGEIVSSLMKEDFEKGFALAQALKDAVHQQPDPLNSAHHRVAHPYCDAITAVANWVLLGDMARVFNNLDGAIFRLEMVEDQIEPELRPAATLKDIREKLKSCLAQHPA